MMEAGGRVLPLQLNLHLVPRVGSMRGRLCHRGVTVQTVDLEGGREGGMWQDHAWHREGSCIASGEPAQGKAGWSLSTQLQISGD